MTSSPLPRLAYRLPEVAAQLGVDRSTVSRWASEGRLISHRINGVVLIKPADLDAFLEQHREGQDVVPLRHRSTRKSRTA